MTDKYVACMYTKYKYVITLATQEGVNYFYGKLSLFEFQIPNVL